jgi:hypothetical protein
MCLFDEYPVSQKSVALGVFGWFSAIQIILGRHVWPITHLDITFPQRVIWNQVILEHPVCKVHVSLS